MSKKRERPGHYQKYRELYLETGKQRRINQKAKAIEYLGGGCYICGYNKCTAALEFHHTDPSIKEMNLSVRHITRAWDKVKEELDKCVLLCANCHREVHADIVSGAASRIPVVNYPNLTQLV